MPLAHVTVPRSVVLVAALCVLAPCRSALALGQARYVEDEPRAGSFALVSPEGVAPLYVDEGDLAGVVRAARDLQADVARVTGRSPTITHDDTALQASAIIVGTLGHSRLVDRLIREGKLDATAIVGRWEASLTQVLENPLPGVARALVIAGSDKRGTIFGIYDLSEQMGVSPWYWWADVPVRHKEALFVAPGRHVRPGPAVRYRGIFLNDEAPALTGWVNEKFGGYNHQFYEKVFELVLRLKGNFLWPAMWNNAFNEDDPLNPKLADEYGIVMSTSHHEPMLRAQQEWKRHGQGPWDYTKNADVLRSFWEEGIRRNKAYESIITLGMRGDGDMPMSASANTALLEKIVADQREILAKEYGPDLSAVPQVWALYKEVQEYYEKGMRVPDDVTLLWCDDNWGNVRRLPTAEERKRKGGAGIYYHFDYVGGPRSYKWLNTVPITKVWEQMSLAYEHGADRIWIVNVGDLKPMEFPIEFFVHLAWDPAAWPKERLAEYGRLWAEREFGPADATAIADVVAKYTKYNGRRKLELLEPTTFSLVDYQEADRVLAEWQAITEKAEDISRRLPQDARDAFFELVLHPTKASAQVTALYVTVGRNRLYAAQGRASTNDLAAQARALFQADADLSAYYNHTLAQGKWNHMMDQTHIGYTYWNQPRTNVMPEVVEIEVPVPAALGVAIEGSSAAWPAAADAPVLPECDVFNRQRRHIDVFNRGRTPFSFSAESGTPWIVLSESEGTVDKERRIWVSVDWDKAPKGRGEGQVIVKGPGAESGVAVRVASFNPGTPRPESFRGFVEGDGYVALEAEHVTRKVDAGQVRWERIDDYGRTASSMATFPFTAPSVAPPQDSPRLEYRMHLFHAGKVQVEAILAPTLNYVPGRGLRFALSFDDQPPQVIDALAQSSLEDWEASVRDSVRRVTSTHTLAKPGDHILRLWMVDPGVVVQRLVVDLGGVRPSYLGPPESWRRP
jgi:hypothetical protein